MFALTVHYGDLDTTNNALASLVSSARIPDAIYVVDQGDAPARFVTEAIVVRPARNYGYGAGLNVGLGRIFATERPAEDDIIIAMNNDVVVTSDSLEALSDWFEQNPDPALVGVQVVEPDGVVMGGGTVSAVTGRASLRYSSREQELGPIDYIHGAFVAAPWRAWRALKGFPEDDFLYWEDVRLSAAAKRAGFPLKVAQTVQVEHHTRAERSLRSDQMYYLVRNGAHYMATHTPLAVRSVWKPLNMARLGWHSIRRSDPAVRAGLRDAVRGHRGRRL